MIGVEPSLPRCGVIKPQRGGPGLQNWGGRAAAIATGRRGSVQESPAVGRGAPPDVTGSRAKIVAILTRHRCPRAGLFGSAARGDTHGASDIDLLVELPGGPPRGCWPWSSPESSCTVPSTACRKPRCRTWLNTSTGSDNVRNRCRRTNLPRCKLPTNGCGVENSCSSVPCVRQGLAMALEICFARRRPEPPLPGVEPRAGGALASPPSCIRRS